MTRRADRVARLWRAWLALLLRCYPRRFRDEMGNDLLSQVDYAPPASWAAFIVRSVATACELVPAGLGARRDD